MEIRSADLGEAAFRAFVRASGLFRNHMEPHFARFGISGAQWGVLRALQRAEAEGLKSLRLNELGQRLLVKAPSVTGILSRLEKLGLVKMETCAMDQRAKNVSLTGQARRLMARVLKYHPGKIREVMAGLAAPEQEALLALMRKLSAHLESIEEVDAHGQRKAPKRHRGTKAQRGADAPLGLQ